MRGEPQPIHIMTQPHCMLLAAAFPRMMHELRTGLSIHKIPTAGAHSWQPVLAGILQCWIINL